jgi:RIO kinase 1
VNENSILMTYYGDEYEPAPTLNRISLGRAEAKLLFEEVIWNIELMLRHNLIHGDLSPYNILYWDAKVILIDFPQVVNSHQNPQAEFILRRDVERVCDYFARFGVKTRTQSLADQLWANYVAETPENILADHWIEPIDDDED